MQLLSPGPWGVFMRSVWPSPPTSHPLPDPHKVPPDDIPYLPILKMANTVLKTQTTSLNGTKVSRESQSSKIVCLMTVLI